jgi:glycerophosphoryl diester phosphodiesterase
MSSNNKLFSFASYPLLFGHRGCSAVAPENTMASFQKILDFRIPGVELDIQIARTGELVVCHDSNLKRTTGKDALIRETDLDEIRSLDAGSWFSSDFSGERIPLLDEVLDLLGNDVYYDLEIKHWDRDGGELERKVVETVQRRGIRERTLVSSFNPYSIRAVRRLDPALHTAHIYTRHSEFPWYLSSGAGRLLCRPEVLKPNRHQLNRRSVFWKKNVLRYPLITWTEDDPKAVRRYLELGVDGIVTNVPEQMLTIIPGRTGHVG